MKVKFSFKFDRDGNYYFGLALLVIASASIIWAFFFDGFDPGDFLVYFLIYAWGFALLLKSDTEYRLNRLETTLAILQARLDDLEAGVMPEAEAPKNETVTTATTATKENNRTEMTTIAIEQCDDIETTTTITEENDESKKMATPMEQKEEE